MSQQTGSSLGPQDHKSDALTTRLPDYRPELPNRRKIFAIYALSLLMYTVASPDPNPRGGGQLPNPKSAILR